MKLQVAEGLSLPLEAVTQTFAVLGIRGSGKSNSAAVLAEQMLTAKLPVVVVDPVGVWWGLRSSKDGKGTGFSLPIFGGRRADVPLDRAAGSLLADLVVEERLSCVLDVTEFSEGDKGRFLTDFAERLYRKNQEPVHMVLEEADDYVPQRPFRDQARCLRAFENIVRRGRARGLGITMVTQRSAAVNKSVLTQAETLIVHRTTSPQDRKAVEGWIEYHGQSKELLESLPGLKDGEAWIWSPHWLGKLVRVQVHRRATFDSASTPKQTQGHRPAATLADVDLGAIQKRMASTIERAKQEDPRELKRQITELRRALATKAEAKPAKVETISTRVEIPVIRPRELQGLKKSAAYLEKVWSRFDHAKAELIGQTQALQGLVSERLKTFVPVPEAQRRLNVIAGVPLDARKAAGQIGPIPSRPGPSADGLPKGESLVLTAIAQHADVSRQQITVLTGYKRSTRDAYIQRLRERGYLVVDGDRVGTTPAGVAALGGDFQRLPTGAALRTYWFEHLPKGEGEIFRVLVDAYPDPVSRDTLTDKTGYKRSTRDAYLQRLNSRELIRVDGRGAVWASDDVFEA